MHALVICSILISSPVFGSDSTFLDAALTEGFGSKAADVKAVLTPKVLAAGQNPESLLQAGDTLVFAHSELPAQKVPLYTAALQGFYHASIVGGDRSTGFFQSYAPSSDTRCTRSFRGSEPYIILRPKPSVVKAKNFGLAVTDMLNQMSLIGYDYDDKFDTEALQMSSSMRGRLHADIMSYQADEPKPKIPKMYCSEVPVTVYALLGIRSKVSISGGDLIDLGLNEDLRTGKTKEAVASESASKLIDAMNEGFVRLINEQESQLESLKNEKPVQVEVKAQLEKQLRSYKSLVHQLQ